MNDDTLDEAAATDGTPTDSAPNGVALIGSAAPVAARRPDGASISVSVSNLVAGAAIAVLVVALALVSMGWFASRGDVADRDTAAADQQHAEQVATDYAVGASTVNFAEITTWLARLKSNAAPQLAGKYDGSGATLQEMLTPLKFTATATPITAKVLSSKDGVYSVTVFLTINSTNVQNPQGARAMVSYPVTVDKNLGWKITEAGSPDRTIPLK
ncbi:hypothetical protein [Nocardia sp. NPDC052566]|uniref:hypothetical protein n=1 Tax=Nocardia sp. NPDC052566 TaxID=3364330 RepID=UPI0037CB4A45